MRIHVLHVEHVLHHFYITILCEPRNNMTFGDSQSVLNSHFHNFASIFVQIVSVCAQLLHILCVCMCVISARACMCVCVRECECVRESALYTYMLVRAQFIHIYVGACTIAADPARY